jgi:hypothetical protein
LKTTAFFFFSLLTLLAFNAFAQNSTFSPYSRYGVGELSPVTFAHNSGMGGAFIAHKPDSTMPIFINAGNPAAYSLIRLTSLEVGGSFHYSFFRGSNNSSLKKWGANFAYGALGFPIAGNGGACFGIMPYSQVGYNTQTSEQVQGIGTVNYLFEGSGGLNKAFIGYGVMPFNKRLTRFRSKRLYIADSLRTLSKFQYRGRELGSKLLSDLSVGFNVNYIFGTIQNVTRVVYPSSSLYDNTYRDRYLAVGDFTGNFGLQTGITIDSVRSKSRRRDAIHRELEILKNNENFTEEQLNAKRDSLEKYTRTYHRALKEKSKLTFGYFGNLNNPLSTSYNVAVYNYILTNLGEEIIRDTALYIFDQKGSITLPLEMGVGMGFKKGERINVVADLALTDWRQYKYIDGLSDLNRNYRTAIGVDFVPEKYAAGRGALARRLHYRLGASYQTGYIRVLTKDVSTWFVSAGIGIPVGIGRLSSMVNVSGQYGQTGPGLPNTLSENFWKVNFGFTFSDRWFQKFRYD